MKPNFTRLQFILLSVVILITSQVQAQPDYIFTGGSLESGTDLQVGAVYRFKNVKPGVDGIMSITDMTNGMTLAQLDGPSGFDEAFQPYIDCAAKKKGYVEFHLAFVIAGTNTPAIMLEVPLTAIDIDGYEFPDEKLYEFDEFEITTTFIEQYALIGSSLNVNRSSGWISATNNTAITYNGIDTIQRDVMFSAIHSNVSSVNFRVGADNKSKNSMQRLRSVYFKKFAFMSGLLPASSLKSFTANSQSNAVQLNWELIGGSNTRSIIIERSNDARQFSAIADRNIIYSEMAQKQIYQDQSASGTSIYYRLRLTDMEGKTSYSNVLMIKGKVNATKGFKVYPNIVQSSATISVASETKQQASMSIVDLSGRMIRQNSLQMQPGNNSMQINGLEKLSTGNYIIVIDLPGERYSQQIVKR
jgi:Secretion system C-terminal sorting domain